VARDLELSCLENGNIEKMGQQSISIDRFASLKAQFDPVVHYFVPHFQEIRNQLEEFM